MREKIKNIAELKKGDKLWRIDGGRLDIIEFISQYPDDEYDDMPDGYRRYIFINCMTEEPIERMHEQLKMYYKVDEKTLNLEVQEELLEYHNRCIEDVKHNIEKIKNDNTKRL